MRGIGDSIFPVGIVAVAIFVLRQRHARGRSPARDLGETDRERLLVASSN